MYGMKRKKKMAKGGEISAKTESRPMPDQRHQDAMEIMHNSGYKAPVQDSMTSRPDIKQSTKGMKTTPIKHPRMVPSDAFSTKLRSEEDDLQMMADGGDIKGVHSPAYSGRNEGQSKAGINAEGHSETGSYLNKKAAKREHKRVLNEIRSMPDPKLKGLAEGGSVDKSISRGEGYKTIHDVDGNQRKVFKDVEPERYAKIHEDDKKRHLYFEGGTVSEEASEDDMTEHPAGLESDNDEMGLPEDEFMASHFADGGLCDAVMKRKYADGGQVDLAANAEEGPSDLDDINEDAAMKENYSESAGLDELTQPTDSNEHGHTLSDEDAHDLVNTIRAKLNKSRVNGNK